MNDYFSLYNITIFICFCFWWHFDQVSNIAIKYKLFKMSEKKEDVKTALSTDSGLLMHGLLKALFYGGVILFSLYATIPQFLSVFVAFFIGVNISNKDRLLEDIVMKSKIEKKPIEERLLNYCDISNISSLIFIATFLLL